MSVMSSVKIGILRRGICDCFLCTTSLLFPVSNKNLTTAIPRILLSVSRQPNKIINIEQ